MSLKKRTERKIMKVSEIKFDTTNPNKMSEKEEKALSLSLDQFGYVYEIIVDKKTNVIADGEHRLKELIKKGIQDIEVKVIDFKGDYERRIFRQVTKKVQGTHDMELDADEFKKILENTDLENFSNLTGQSEQEILNIINASEREDKAVIENTEQVDKLYGIKITCPKCKHVFEKKEQ